jgi:hypothetical protein
MPDVRFGSQADILAIGCDIRFTPKSGHSEATVGCPLCADFVAEVGCELFWSVIPSL